MANNRMFLVHVPTGLAVPLARQGDTWETCVEPELLTTFFHTLRTAYYYEGAVDEFALLLESQQRLTEAPEGWAYGDLRPDGLRQIIWDTPRGSEG